MKLKRHVHAHANAAAVVVGQGGNNTDFQITAVCIRFDEFNGHILLR